MIKRIFTLTNFLLIFSFLNTSPLYAQPSNDEPCNAMALETDGSIKIVNNKNATSSAEEENIVPPTGSFDALGNCIGGWCDFTGLDGGAGIDHSVWFKFTAPFDKSVSIDICGSTFDSQLALYQVGNCADYATYTYIYSSDDQQGCGNFPDANGDGNPEVNLSSTLQIECLNGGEEYYLLVDAWQDLALAGFIEGDIVISITELGLTATELTLDNNPILSSPPCPGEAGGSIDVSVITGIEPITYIWDNGDTTQDLIDVSSGVYKVTATDYCGSVTIKTYTLMDGEAEQISIGNFTNTVVQPLDCDGGGKVSLPIVAGVPPFTYEWSPSQNGEVILDELPDGVYSVTISDACPNTPPLVETFEISTPTPDGTPTAGPDIQLNNTCVPTKIGFNNEYGLAVNTMISPNSDQIPGGNVQCTYGNPNTPPQITDGSIATGRHWQSFDLSNFDIPNGAVLKGVEVFLRCLTNQLNDETGVPYEPGLLVDFTIHTVNSTELDDPDLKFNFIDSITTFIPTTEGFVSYFVPFPKAEDTGIDANDIIAVSVQTRGTFGAGHYFLLGATETQDPQANTYFSGCNIDNPTKLTDLDPTFIEKTIMNLYFTKPGKYTYQWDGDVDDPTSATPTAQGISEAVYNVTITDHCGGETTDAVDVKCWTVGLEELEEASFSISPNPSAGVFQLQNDGPSREMLIQVFDLYGKRIYQESKNIGMGAQESLDLSYLAKGIYWAKLSDDQSLESHRLIIQ